MENVLLPLIGGVLIGVSSTTMLGGLGRITGISGIVASILGRPKAEDLWRYGFLLGLIAGGFLLKFLYPHFFAYQITASVPVIIVGGLLVGIGTRMGSGCTSGHGVCGIARLAKRSLVATAVFMLFGILTASLRGLL